MVSSTATDRSLHDNAGCFPSLGRLIDVLLHACGNGVLSDERGITVGQVDVDQSLWEVQNFARVACLRIMAAWRAVFVLVTCFLDPINLYTQ